MEAARLAAVRDQGTLGDPAFSDPLSPASPSNRSSEEGVAEGVGQQHQGEGTWQGDFMGVSGAPGKKLFWLRLGLLGLF